MNTLTLEQFDAYLAQLRQHDWFFDFSDDGYVWRRGRAARDALNATAKQHPALQQVFDLYHASVFNAASGFRSLGVGLTSEERDSQLWRLRAHTFGLED